MSKNFVRGGQLHIHNLRMIKQVMTVGILISFFIGAGLFSLKVMKNIPFFVLKQYVVSYKAEWILPWKPEQSRHRYSVSWPNEKGSTNVRAIDIVNHYYIHQVRDHVEKEVVQNLGFALNAFLLSFFSLFFFWFVKGKVTFNSKRLRGQRLVSSFWLALTIYFRRKASDLKVEKLPLIKNSETKHILAVGTTGAGKTNLYNELLPQIEKRENKALVIDTTGDMVSKYYSPIRGDVIINPFDSRTSNWDIVNECNVEYQFDNLAQSIVPKNGEHSDPVWKNGSAKLFSVGLQKAKEQGLSPKELHRILVQVPLKEFGAFFWGSDAYPFADPKGDRTTLSFRSTLASSVQFLKYLGNGSKNFSLSNWIKDEKSKSWVFITANEDMIPSLNPLMAAFFNSTSTILMSLKESFDRRLWFIVDELPAIQKLQSLQAILSKGRKYGACFFAGIQGMSQFEEIYGHHGAKTILNLFNTKFFFRCEELQTTEQVSRWLGEEEIEEAKESLSYGAHQMRDGVSMNQQKSIRRLVLPTEVAQLPDLSCYLNFPGKFPIAKLKMTYNDIQKQHEEFQLTT